MPDNHNQLQFVLFYIASVLIQYDYINSVMCKKCSPRRWTQCCPPKR